MMFCLVLAGTNHVFIQFIYLGQRCSFQLSKWESATIKNCQTPPYQDTSLKHPRWNACSLWWEALNWKKQNQNSFHYCLKCLIGDNLIPGCLLIRNGTLQWPRTPLQGNIRLNCRPTLALQIAKNLLTCKEPEDLRLPVFSQVVFNAFVLLLHTVLSWGHLKP